jgi:putative oxidoreductase
MRLRLLVVRGVVGGLFVGHGAQKLFGWFGGHGPKETGQFFDNVGVRPGRRTAIAAGAAEAGGGALLVAGLFTALAGAALSGVMITAIRHVHSGKGPWVTEGGYEYNLVLIVAAVGLAMTGPGLWSIDAAAGWALAGPVWGLVALLLGALGGVGILGMRQPAAPAAEEEAEEAARAEERRAA